MGERRDYLDESIRRIREAIDARPEAYEKAIGAVIPEQTPAVVDERMDRKIARQLERQERRSLRRRDARARNRSGGKPEAIVFGLAAVVVLMFAVSDPRRWWLLFIALGLAMKAAQALRWSRVQTEGTNAERMNEETADADRSAMNQATASTPTREIFPEIETRTGRVNAICEKLLAELREGSKLLREVINRPEDTVKALRDSCRELARREIQLRSSIRPEDGERLKAERGSLVAQLEREQDQIVRDRLTAALTALDAQISQRAHLLTVASRFGAEATRILYTLENLYAQVLTAKSSDASSRDVAGAGLRQSLVQVTEEMAAVAEALEAVNRDDQVNRDTLEAPAAMSPVQGISSTEESDSGTVRDRLRS